MNTIAAIALATATQAITPAQPTEVKGTFDVKVTPAPGAPATADDNRGRMTFTKTFYGALAGTGEGEMLTAGSPATGTAGYVALERFTGTLAGRRGSFVMQHSGTMQAGRQDLAIVIAPGSGTGELAGIAGTATIDIEGKQHYYTLRYTLPAR
ncbi:DUF3224 domain-containing protein [Pseudoduganella lutea]|uniref:DUF3224 domain-containing protein n=1 Tax=Pseudoduganella lutea TaxID=321985 RepID=A0A4P6L3U4_9BURK|nr:DUF3224 domain-containing protein [Pseudoduganella lutea]QBE66117.1 DUF3224 domain-containing protein [Pseudoduganella lutea]